MVGVISWGHWTDLAKAVVVVANIIIAVGVVVLTYDQLNLSENKSQTIFDRDISVNANFTDTGLIPTNWYPGPGPSAKWTIDASQFKFVRVMYVLNFSCSCHADAMSARIWGEHLTLAGETVRLTHGGTPYFGNYTITVTEHTYFTSVTIDCDARNGPPVFCDFKGTVRAHLFIGTFSTRL